MWRRLVRWLARHDLTQRDYWFDVAIEQRNSMREELSHLRSERIMLRQLVSDLNAEVRTLKSRLGESGRIRTY